ncbi:MAG: NusG domain II-containing protein [Spirochaetes bacterium]|nr:NusG domain II-containing protein [Spirochaetota bacterium]
MECKLPAGRVAKPFDFAILTLALALTGFSVYSVYFVPRDFAQVLIEGSGLRWVFPLDSTTQTVAVAGPLGDTIVRIQGGQTWVESSPCDNQVCVMTGRLQGQWGFAACLPNHVLLVIQGNDGHGLDGRTW